jgi:hypothetical protein
MTPSIEQGRPPTPRERARARRATQGDGASVQGCSFRFDRRRGGAAARCAAVPLLSIVMRIDLVGLDAHSPFGAFGRVAS